VVATRQLLLRFFSKPTPSKGSIRWGCRSQYDAKARPGEAGGGARRGNSPACRGRMAHRKCFPTIVRPLVTRRWKVRGRSGAQILAAYASGPTRWVGWRDLLAPPGRYRSD
jgi:hypothetical protein